MNIRLATSADAETIAQQRDAMFVDMGEAAEKLARVHDSSLAWHRRALESGLYTGFLAETDGEIVGGAGLLWQDLPPNPDTDLDVRGYVMNVYVRPDQRGQGLARRLLERVLDECAAHGVTQVSLHASEAGRPLYEKLGFKPTNEMKLKVERP
ncbi:GNAT family N-acetyltransferase [Deinococcus radiodurans]|jgi:Predicted acetyltransferase|uniref:Acetyltransferase, putative n=1 Tax=Deinococcus radiodurans (strain ATCC 13939 / DSM 20539 / JCM 16871 / CCUG 27074 / LMG 4051 / NBRC 15346 / NCIMB 9279 / VKM B-1422 / R1) TaxID=243230 RepID=Q9RWJ2_DEIRA|nr:GNAT family N-acetyltransferase [Deinococcus radiodurans]AAF10251.1 acetyltransferase, putative [Deinococcus radiodurans R1 = ATCC 13939 = DSM 20539]ANC72096.1 acetyltransferase [Deinococcus radiodurans R1 = ATCC 13939 = DSM 20539]QEM72617.1 GNAT family N-acetyltransferase [Deinococcus radiodurans]QIP28833.1 GNAT family N-acetyltransferase [Deinococcus radiodurans]QIP32461.1 GNAT family N-acetyltransferase [Deinococcus radiodurans]